MYSVIKSTDIKVIFVGNQQNGFADDLLIKQMGFLCRKEVLTVRFGEMLEEYLITNNSPKIKIDSVIKHFIQNRKHFHKF